MVEIQNIKAKIISDIQCSGQQTTLQFNINELCSDIKKEDYENSFDYYADLQNRSKEYLNSLTQEEFLLNIILALTERIDALEEKVGYLENDLNWLSRHAVTE